MARANARYEGVRKIRAAKVCRILVKCASIELLPPSRKKKRRQTRRSKAFAYTVLHLCATSLLLYAPKIRRSAGCHMQHVLCVRMTTMYSTTRSRLLLIDVISHLQGIQVVWEYSVESRTIDKHENTAVLSVRLLHDCFLNFFLCNHPDKAGLFCDLLKNIQYISIALDETKLGVDEPLFLGKLFHQ